VAAVVDRIVAQQEQAVPAAVRMVRPTILLLPALRLIPEAVGVVVDTLLLRVVLVLLAVPAS
jgi:hypothetical protein